MTITAKFIDPQNSAIEIMEEGTKRFAPAQGSDRDYLDTSGVQIAAYVEPNSRTVTYAAFTERFTVAEFANVRTAVLADAEAMSWALDAAADNQISLDSQRTSDFLDKLVTAAIISAARKNELLA